MSICHPSDLVAALATTILYVCAYVLNLPLLARHRCAAAVLTVLPH